MLHAFLPLSLHTHIILALSVVELLLVPVFQHFLHHPTAPPNIKHRLAVLVTHLLHQQEKDNTTSQ